MAATRQTVPAPIAEPTIHRCPTDVSDVADRYLLNRLTPEEAEAFEEHFLHCALCADSAQLAYDFITGLKDLASSSRRPVGRAAGHLQMGSLPLTRP